MESNPKNVIKKAEKLLRELYGFKDNADFHELGFGLGGPYNAWLQKIEQLQTDPEMKATAFEGNAAVASLPFYLRLIGMEYMKSKGEETNFTRTFQSEIIAVAKKSIRG